MSEKKEFIYNGKTFTSYYQLEKKMGISRKTIQYRHEKIGLPLEEIPYFIPKRPIDRLGVIQANKGIKEKSIEKNVEQDIILYPEAPEFDFGSSSEETKGQIKLYIIWLREAPEALLLRELHISKTKLRNSNYTEINSLKKRLTVIEKVIEMRGLNKKI